MRLRCLHRIFDHNTVTTLLRDYYSTRLFHLCELAFSQNLNCKFDFWCNVLSFNDKILITHLEAVGLEGELFTSHQLLVTSC